MPTLEEIKAKALAAKQNANQAIGAKSNASTINPIIITESGNSPSGEKLNNPVISPDGNQSFDTGDRTYQGNGIYGSANTGIDEQSDSPEIRNGMLPAIENEKANSEHHSLIADKDEPIQQDAIESSNKNEPITDDITNEDGSINIQAVLAKEFNSTEEDIELFRRIYIATGQAVTKLSITDLTERITHCQKAIKIIEALQQACVRVKKDKLDNESSADRVKRLQADKAYKPKKRATNVDKTGAIIPVKVSAREKLITKFMKSGMSREKAERLLDED